ncbi:hypothetical protein N7490_003409 [Penicillium lividum]|nr:hypothetical protein N7490_003409 [Penicillium lividum]
MASRASMLLDPKGYKKQLQQQGNDSFNPFPPYFDATETPLLPLETRPVLQIETQEESPASLSLSPSHPSTLNFLEPHGSLSPLSGPSSTNISTRPSVPSIAPPGTSPAVQFSATIPRKLSPKAMPVTSSPAPSDGPNPESNVTVMFTSAKDDGNESDAKRSYHDMSEDDERIRPRGMIEDIYGVEERRHQPVKRMKVEDTSKPGTPSHQVRNPDGGDLGEFMKKERTNHTSSSAAMGVVDLTVTPPNDKDDDDLQFTGSNDLSTQRVCYGKIEGATIQASLVPTPSSISHFPNQWPIIRLNLRRDPEAKDFRIAVADSHGIVFGFVDPRTAKALCPLLDHPKIPLDIAARLDPRIILPNEIPGQPISTTYRASLILYGERQRAQYVGQHLSQNNIWLGVPPMVEKGTPVWNPHDERRRALAAAAAINGTSNRSAVRYETRTAEEVTDTVTKMFNQLVSADVPRMEPPESVVTPLLDHQKQALWFMTEKEKRRKFGPEEGDNNSLWRLQRASNGQEEYKEIITGAVSDKEPLQVFGGLLADMMGLGKTLSILSLVMSSLRTAYEYEKKAPPKFLTREAPGIRNTRTTLLVAPLSAVKNWTLQVEEHLKPDSLKFYVFHGSNRTTKLKELATYDLIITTYSTVLSELSPRNARPGRESPFRKMNMFRIVLDEAHVIREQNAQQTKAILSLHAQRRWSVTGTPVQNRLEDLHSVLRFLRLAPYDDGTHFRQFILSRFKNGDPTVLTSLRVLIDSFTLRRVKDRISLPDREDHTIHLSFTEKEAQLHEYFRTESNQMMGVLVGKSKTKMGGRMYHHVLKAMMLLRQVSAHGKELLDLEDRERIKGLSVNDAIDLEENEADDGNSVVLEKKACGMYTLMQESNADNCAICGEHLDEPIRGGSGDVDRDAQMAIFLPCFDVLCPACFNAWSEFHGTSDEQVRCKACEGWIPRAFTMLTPGILEVFTTRQAEQRSNRKYGKVLGDYEGPHTKTKALIQFLQESADESKALEGEPPIKSVVFSAWTTHLDLIEIALKENNLDSFTRLDGTMTLANRGKALDAFAKDNNITILLATIGAGGVGLNLTSASRVYIMEPQYNPAAVAQAIDRVHRLGQSRPVKTVQFIMKSSIEEKILELAKKKQHLADMSMNRGKLNKAEDQEQRMQEYRGLFK